MRKRIHIIIALAILALTGCAVNNESVSNSIVNVSNNATVSANEEMEFFEEADNEPEAIRYSLSGNMIAKISKYDQLEYYNEETATIISSIDGGVNISGEGAILNGTTIMLTEEGTYIVRGSFPDCSIYVNARDDKKVHLVLDNVQMACTSTAPIYSAHCDKLIITLPAGTTSYISDATSHINDDANGTLYGMTDITVNGSGTLNITGTYNSGVQIKKNFKVYGTSINIEAVNNGIKGNNSVTLVNSHVTITAGGDGIKTSEEEDKAKGYIYIDGGIVEVTADDDVLQATNGCVIRGNASVRGRCYGSLVNCKAGYVEGDETIVTWE